MKSHKINVLAAFFLLGGVACNNSNIEEPKNVEEVLGKYSAEQTIYDQSGESYLTYTVYSDDESALNNYLKGDFKLVSADVIIQDDILGLSEDDAASEPDYTVPENNIISIIKDVKLGVGFENGYQVDVYPPESDLRGWNYTGWIQGYYSYKRFQVNRHTAWHRVFVASKYLDDIGNYDQGFENFTSVPNNSASVGYNRCYEDVYKWYINIQYRKSKHYSYGFSVNCN